MTYGLVMIAKDEAKGIEKTLDSVKPYISYWTIVDTGSTDGTQDIIKRSMNGIPGQLVERPWVNFGHNRSEAFALAKGTADWLLTMDADMTVEIDDDFDPDALPVEMYLAKMELSDLTWRTPVLIRGDIDWISVGAVHEYTCKAGRVRGETQDTDKVRLNFEYRPSSAKTDFYIRMLEEDLANEPDNERAMFYLALSYRDAGRKEEARAMFKRREAMGGWDQEVFYAKYQAACLADWPERADELMSAWELRPWRIEPLVTLITDLNALGDYQTAYQLSQIVPMAHKDTLFVQKAAWDYILKFERSVAASGVGRIMEARALCEELLRNPRLPDMVRETVEKNLALVVSVV